MELRSILIPLLLSLQCWTPDDGQRDCPKLVEFYSKNKFEKLVHFVGFIVRIGHKVSRLKPCGMRRCDMGE